MIDFSNVEQLSVAGKTARYEVPRLAGFDPAKPVVIIGRYAGASNKALNNALLKEMGFKTRNVKKGFSPAMLERQRAAIRKLFPRHVFTDWENMVDVEGNEVPFSIAHAEQFCAKIDDEYLADIREFFEDESEFYNEDSPRIDAEEVAGN